MPIGTVLKFGNSSFKKRIKMTAIYNSTTDNNAESTTTAPNVSDSQTSIPSDEKRMVLRSEGLIKNMESVRLSMVFRSMSNKAKSLDCWDQMVLAKPLRSI